MKDIWLAAGLAQHILKDMAKINPDIGKEYKGVFLKYIKEYKKTFLDKDMDFIKKHYKKDKEIIEDTKLDLDSELMHIECFCKWLEKEKKVKLTND